jgi:hypothetical protein
MRGGEGGKGLNREIWEGAICLTTGGRRRRQRGGEGGDGDGEGEFSLPREEMGISRCGERELNTPPARAPHAHKQPQRKRQMSSDHWLTTKLKA